MTNDGRRSGRARRGVYRSLGMGGAMAFVLALLLCAPQASAGKAGVTLTAPYSGVAYTATQTTFSGIGCPGTGNSSLIGPYFSLKAGRGGGGPEAVSQPCASWVDEYHQVDIWFGLNLTTFTASTTITNDHVRFHWVLTYYLLVNTTWGGGSDVSYAYAGVSVGAWVYDVTTGINTGSSTAYDNFTYLDDAKGTQQISITPYEVRLAMEVTVTLVAGDTYELYSYVQSECRAETDGPLGSNNNALAQVSWPGTGPSGKLKSVTY